MPVFLLHKLEGNKAYLDENESRHLSRVLRLRKEDTVQLVDGQGNLYHGMVMEPDPARSIIRIERTVHEYLKKPYKIHIAIAPTKSTDRFEWFLEKATEIGIDEITPLLCDRSERRQVRTERSEKIILSAMKQSGRAYKPRLNPMVPFRELLDKPATGVKLIAHCGAEAAEPDETSDHWLILIGPEGDFTENEIRTALESGFRELSLGEAVYRTETAGIVACQFVHFLQM